MIDKEGIKQEDDLNATKKEKDEVDREYGELLKQKKLKESVLTTMGTTLENDCWNLTKAIRERFPETQMSGTKTKKGFLAKIRTVQAPTGHDEDELKNQIEGIIRMDSVGLIRYANQSNYAKSMFNPNRWGEIMNSLEKV